MYLKRFITKSLFEKIGIANTVKLRYSAFQGQGVRYFFAAYEQTYACLQNLHIFDRTVPYHNVLYSNFWLYVIYTYSAHAA